MFDLPAYLARIGLASAPAPDAAGLAVAQRAHRHSIPFENLDIPLGRGISIDPDTVFDKIVTRRRGGYCFEQNQLFLRALHAIGFEARPLLARVWLAADGIPPRTHTLNLVEIDGEQWIADAGFGGSYTPPMRLVEDEEAETPDGVRHRLSGDEDHGWMLHRVGPASLTDGRAANGDWHPQYSFTLDPVAAADLELANHWTSTRPNTRFTTLRVASIATPAGYASLLDRAFNRAGPDAEQRTIAHADAYRALLADSFGLDLEPDEVERLGLF